MPIQQQNFMIKNKAFFIYSVGANCVRPLSLQYTPTGEHSSPLQKSIHRISVNLKIRRTNKKRPSDFLKGDKNAFCAINKSLLS